MPPPKHRVSNVEVGVQVPAWFTKHFVHAPDSSAPDGHQITVVEDAEDALVELDPEHDILNEDQNAANGYAVHRSMYKALEDRVACARTGRHQLDDGGRVPFSLASRRDVIQLEVPGETVGAHGFLVAMIQDLARKQGAHLVVFTLENLCDLTHHFQKQSSTTSAGTARTHAKKLNGLADFFRHVLAVCLQGARRTTRSQTGKEQIIQGFVSLVGVPVEIPQPPPPGPLVVGRPNNNNVFDPNRTVRDALSALTECLSAEVKRTSEDDRAELLIFASVPITKLFPSSPAPEPRRLPPAVRPMPPPRPPPYITEHQRHRDLVHAALVTKLIPVDTPSQRQLLRKQGAEHTEMRNIGAIQYILRLRTPKDSADVPFLCPYATWRESVGTQTKEALGRRLLSYPEAKAIADILDASTSIEEVMKVVLDAIKGLNLCEAALDKWKAPKEEPGPPSLAELPASVRIRKVIDRLKEDQNKYEWELDLTDSIVKPADMKDTWSSIEVDRRVKSSIQRLINSSVHGHRTHGILKEVQGGGALLYGPPGTGKTHLARILAKESGAVMIEVSTAELASKWVSETEKNIKALFNLARMLAPSIIFIDEADALFRSRNAFHTTGWETSRVTQLLRETDGLARSTQTPPLLLLATNFPKSLDHAVLRRVPVRLYLSLPSRIMRSSIMRIHLKNEDLDSDVDFGVLGRKTRGFSGSDLKTLCFQAALISQSRLEADEANLSGSRRVLHMDDFDEALKEVAPTVGDRSMREMESFAKEFDRPALSYMKRPDDWDEGYRFQNDWSPLTAKRKGTDVPGQMPPAKRREEPAIPLEGTAT